MRRLFINRFDVGNSRLGNMIIRITSGRPRIVGVMKEANKFSFILFLKGYFVFAFWLMLILGCDIKCVLQFLIER